MKEIWFINQYAISPDLPGGTRHYDFAVELVKAGHSVRIFAATANLALSRQTRELNGKLWLEEIMDGVLFEWVDTGIHRRNDWRRALNMLKFSWNVYRAGLRQGKRPDLIVGSSPHPFAAYAAYQLSRKLDSRFVFEVRDLWPQALIDMKGLPEKHPMVWVMRRLERKLCNHAHNIFVLAEGSIDYLKNNGVPGERISFLPNGIHPEHCIPQRTRWENRSLYGFDKFTIIYTGAHGPANALHTILRAAQELSEESWLEFVLVGGGPLKSDLKARARELGLNNIRFLDPVPKGEIPDLLFAADAAVITLQDVASFYNAVSPNKLFDYLAGGKPVLCAAPGTAAEMIEQYGCGLTSPPEDGEALAKQVLKMAALTLEERSEMGERGKELVLERFSRPKLARKLIELVEN